jgi:hypothetical protein
VTVHGKPIDLRSGFAGVYAWVAASKGVRIHTPQGTEYEVVATAGRRGAHADEPVLRFMRDGVESARAYACCWGHTYNCYGASIKSCTLALDQRVRGATIWSVEEAAIALVAEHRQAPYAILGREDARACLAAALANECVPSLDDQQFGLVHVAYPASFDLASVRSKDRVAVGDGEAVSYDVAVLRRQYVRRNLAEALLRPDVSTRERKEPRLQAVVQVVVDDRGLGKRRSRALRRALRVLRATGESVERVLMVLMRYRRKSLKAWDRDWPRIAKLLDGAGIRVAVCVQWLTLGAAAEQAYWGPWLHPVTTTGELGLVPRRVLGTAGRVATPDTPAAPDRLGGSSGSTPPNLPPR